MLVLLISHYHFYLILIGIDSIIVWPIESQMVEIKDVNMQTRNVYIMVKKQSKDLDVDQLVLSAQREAMLMVIVESKMQQLNLNYQFISIIMVIIIESTMIMKTVHILKVIGTQHVFQKRHPISYLILTSCSPSEELIIDVLKVRFIEILLIVNNINHIQVVIR